MTRCTGSERVMACTGAAGHHAGMRAKTAIRIYPGIVEAVAEERFRIHEREMAWQGWYAAESGVDTSPISPVERRGSLEKHLQVRKTTVSPAQAE